MSDDKPKKHWHNQSCFGRKVVCGKIDHTHVDACYEKNSVALKCGRDSHTHDADCFLQYTKCGYS